MVKLKTKIVEVDSSFEEKKKTSIINLLISIIILLIILSVCYIIYTWAKPYINAVDIEKIAGRRIVITECNTKDYLIIGKDKAYSMSITNENCEKENYDGNIKLFLDMLKSSSAGV